MEFYGFDISLEMLFAIVSSIAATIVALWKLHGMRYNDRIFKFKSTYNLISKNRFIYSEVMIKAMGAFKRNEVPHNFSADYFNGWMDKSKYLICRNEWIFFSNAKEVKLIPRDKPRWRKNSFLEIMQLPDRRKNYVQNVRKHIQKLVFNEGVICFLKLDKDRQIEVYNSKYYEYQNMIAFQEFIKVKSIDECFDRNGDDDSKVTQRVRKLVSDSEPFDMNNRPVVIGACSLCFIKNVPIKDGENTVYKTFMLAHHRGGDVNDARNTISMTPAGALTWTTVKGSNEDHWSYYYTVLREFEEEVLGFRDVEYVEDYDPISSLEDEEMARVYYMGMGLDPLNMKMESIAVMMVEAGIGWREIKDAIKKRNNAIQFEDQESDGISLADLSTIVKQNKSEGEIILVSSDSDTLLRLMYNKKSMPVFREALFQLLSNEEQGFEAARKELGLVRKDLKPSSCPERSGRAISIRRRRPSGRASAKAFIPRP